MVNNIQTINKQEAKIIKKNCPNIQINRTQKSKSKRGIFYIPETVIFTGDINFDIVNLQNLIDAYDYIKGDVEADIIKNRLIRNLKYKKSLLK